LKDITDHRDPAESAENSEPAEPIENADKNEPTEPTESAEPIEPIDRTEPLQPIDNTEFSDHKDHRDPDFSPRLTPRTSCLVDSQQCTTGGSGTDGPGMGI
jgi:hypothetical protein